MRKAARAADAVGNTVETLLREKRRKQAIFGRAARMEVLAHAAEHAAQTRGGRRRNAQRPDDPLRVEPEYFAGRCACAERACRSRDVPAAIVVPRIDRETHPARHIETEDQRMQQLLSRHGALFGERGERRAEARRWDG